MNDTVLRYRRRCLNYWLQIGEQQIGSKYQVWGKGDRFRFGEGQNCDALFAETVGLPEWVPREEVHRKCRQLGRNGFQIVSGRSSLYKNGPNELLLVWEEVPDIQIPSFDDLVAGGEGSAAQF